MKTSDKVSVLIVDDSAPVRHALRGILESDPEIEVLATAPDPYAAVKCIREEVPDVITLDIDMPRMDGLTFLDRIMSQHPIPVVICSATAGPGSGVAIEALEKGAVKVLSTSELGRKECSENSRTRICHAVKSAARVRLGNAYHRRFAIVPKLTADAVLPKPSGRPIIETTARIVVVGASTGGTEALREFLEAMPAEAPGIAIVQHMPELFTDRFAHRLDRLCRMTVKEAAEGDEVVAGRALIAPGDRHMMLKRRGRRYFIELKDGPRVSRHRPSVDVLFRSAARQGGKNVVGVILTGMGDDGARGMLEMKQAGAFNIAQDAATCVVYGMPAEAVKLGAVDRVLPLKSISREVVRRCHERVEGDVVR